MSIITHMFGRLRANLNSLKSVLATPAEGEAERFNFRAELPGAHDKPLWRMQLQLHSEPHGDGEKLRLRAHFETNLASALRPALEARAAGKISGSRELTLAGRASAAAQNAASRALRLPLLRAVAEPLLQHDFNTWVEMHASTASLDAGARDLLPQGEKLAALGIVPQKKEGPVAESWAGEAAGGFAQVSLLQMDKKHLPERLQRALGEKPFQFAAAIVNTVEEK